MDKKHLEATFKRNLSKVIGRRRQDELGVRTRLVQARITPTLRDIGTCTQVLCQNGKRLIKSCRLTSTSCPYREPVLGFKLKISILMLLE